MKGKISVLRKSFQSRQPDEIELNAGDQHMHFFGIVDVIEIAGTT